MGATACPVPLRVATCIVIQLSKISAADPHGIGGTASQEHEFLKTGKEYSIVGMLQEKTVCHHSMLIPWEKNCENGTGLISLESP